MVALRSIHDQAAPISSGNTCTQEAQRRASLIERMSGMYCQMNRHKRVLRNIGQIFLYDLIILPVQCQAAREHLLLLRQVSQRIHRFYCMLAPIDMRDVAPWGTLVKLQCLEEDVTELILLLCALEAMCMQPSYNRVQLHLTIRQLYPRMFDGYDETVSQLKALVEKAREQTPRQEEEQA